MKHNKLSIVLVVFIASAIFVVLIIILFVFKNREKEIVMREEASHYTVYFKLNGATKIDNKKLTCTKENKGCFITLPKSYRENGVVLGYSEDEKAKEPKYQENETISIDSDITLYVISYEIYSLHVSDTQIDYVENNDMSCKSYNKIDACTVKLPLFNKIGYENRGYSTSSTSLTGFTFPNEEYTINKNTTLYPIYGTISRNRTLKIDKSDKVFNSIIEKEEACSMDRYETLLNYINDISLHAPYLLIGSKITFVGDKTFDEVWGGGFVGMNFGPRNLRSLDIRCSNYLFNNYYATMIHEMSHSWDFYYATKMGKNITNENDIINLYNKYVNDTKRPFRDYSFSSIYEFFADMMRYYYFKYVVPTSGFSNLDYPEDIKKTLEKYICIAENDYDTNRCK